MDTVGCLLIRFSLFLFLYAIPSQIVVRFIKAFYKLPAGALDALLELAINALALQERYSLVSACTFLVSPPDIFYPGL